jgi:hypothetical protein
VPGTRGSSIELAAQGLSRVTRPRHRYSELRQNSRHNPGVPSLAPKLTTMSPCTCLAAPDAAASRDKVSVLSTSNGSICPTAYAIRTWTSRPSPNARTPDQPALSETVDDCPRTIRKRDHRSFIALVGVSSPPAIEFSRRRPSRLPPRPLRVTLTLGPWFPRAGIRHAFAMAHSMLTRRCLPPDCG